MKYLLTLVLVVGLWPTCSTAQVRCDYLWRGLDKGEAQDVMSWASEQGILDQGRVRMERLAEHILAFVHRNCRPQLVALGLTDAEFLSYTITRNFMSSAGTVPQSIGQGAFARRLVNTGWVTGLPATTTSWETKPQRAASAPQKRQAPVRKTPRPSVELTFRGMEIKE